MVVGGTIEDGGGRAGSVDQHEIGGTERALVPGIVGGEAIQEVGIGGCRMADKPVLTKKMRWITFPTKHIGADAVVIGAVGDVVGIVGQGGGGGEVGRGGASPSGDVVGLAPRITAVAACSHGHEVLGEEALSAGDPDLLVEGVARAHGHGDLFTDIVSIFVVPLLAELAASADLGETVGVGGGDTFAEDHLVVGVAPGEAIGASRAIVEPVARARVTVRYLDTRVDDSLDDIRLEAGFAGRAEDGHRPDFVLFREINSVVAQSTVGDEGVDHLGIRQHQVWRGGSTALHHVTVLAGRLCGFGGVHLEPIRHEIGVEAEMHEGNSAGALVTTEEMCKWCSEEVIELVVEAESSILEFCLAIGDRSSAIHVVDVHRAARFGHNRTGVPEFTLLAVVGIVGGIVAEEVAVCRIIGEEGGALAGTINSGVGHPEISWFVARHWHVGFEERQLWALGRWNLSCKGSFACHTNRVASSGIFSSKRTPVKYTVNALEMLDAGVVCAGGIEVWDVEGLASRTFTQTSSEVVTENEAVDTEGAGRPAILLTVRDSVGLVLETDTWEDDGVVVGGAEVTRGETRRGDDVLLVAVLETELLREVADTVGEVVATFAEGASRTVLHETVLRSGDGGASIAGELVALVAGEALGGRGVCRTVGDKSDRDASVDWIDMNCVEVTSGTPTWQQVGCYRA